MVETELVSIKFLDTVTHLRIVDKRKTDKEREAYLKDVKRQN